MDLLVLPESRDLPALLVLKAVLAIPVQRERWALKEILVLRVRKANPVYLDPGG